MKLCIQCEKCRIKGNISFQEIDNFLKGAKHETLLWQCPKCGYECVLLIDVSYNLIFGIIYERENKGVVMIVYGK